MRINTASHSHSELLLKMGMDLKNIVGQLYFVPVSSPYRECYSFFVLFCFVLKSAKASSVINLVKKVPL